MSVCRVTEDYRKNFQKAVIWKGRKRQQVAGIPYGSMMFSE
jgi:hypothetical protein